MQIAESTRVPSPRPESNPVIGVLSDEIVVLAERGGVAIGPGRGFSTFVRPVRHSSRQGSPARTRSVEIPLIGSDGEISGVLCREIPLAERANPVTDSELQRLQEIDEVAKVFVHDINNVLSVIGGGLRLLECQGDAVAREVIFERMYRAVERGVRLSRSLLDAGRHPRPSTREFASQAHLTAAAETLGHALGERTRLEVEISPDLWEFSADPEQLFFALLNLCRNADAAMSCGGVVSIIATNVDPLPAAPQGAVVITVADNGSGMSEDVLSRAFEPYYTTKAPATARGWASPRFASSSNNTAARSGWSPSRASARRCAWSFRGFPPRRETTLRSLVATHAPMPGRASSQSATSHRILAAHSSSPALTPRSFEW